MTRNDPTTGKFTQGNPGRPKGTKNTRTLQWEELGREIMDGNAGRFNDLLGRLWDSPRRADQIRAAELYLRVAEFFRPKLQRVYASDPNTPPVPVINIVVKPPSFDQDGPERTP